MPFVVAHTISKVVQRQMSFVSNVFKMSSLPSSLFTCCGIPPTVFLCFLFVLVFLSEFKGLNVDSRQTREKNTIH